MNLDWLNVLRHDLEESEHLLGMLRGRVMPLASFVGALAQLLTYGQALFICVDGAIAMLRAWDKC